MMFGGLLMIAFWGLIIGGAAWLVVKFARGDQGAWAMPSARQTPLEILRTRYAKGEITKEQFDQMRRDLGA